MNKKLKKLLFQIIVAAVFFALFWLPQSLSLRLALLGGSYLSVGLPVIIKALRNIRRGQVFDENFLMAIATFGAIALGEYAEAVAVMLFYQIGEFFQSYTVNRSRESIAALMNIRPDSARVLRNGKAEIIAPEKVEIGELIEVRPGEKIPLDGIVISGDSLLDTAALTGEAMPRNVSEKSEVLSGCISLNGVIRIKTTKKFGESTVAKILELVENAASQKADIENFITKFARYYTPAVVIIALFLFLLPPLFFNGQSFSEWGYRAITFLVISCPCALVISIPLSFFGGIGAASKCGILVKGGNYIEGLAGAEVVVFDKTGTLTKGIFKVSEIKPKRIAPEKLLETAAYIEAFSSHPIALSIKAAYGKELDMERLGKTEEIVGSGIITELDGIEVAAGNEKMLRRFKLPMMHGSADGTVIYLIIDGQYAGYIRIADEVKDDAATAIISLKNEGILQTVMLTGDRKASATSVAKKIGIDKVFAELLPADKVAKVEELLADKTPKGKLLFVGDGINDAPVLARSDVGIAMGGMGSDAAIEAADVVIMTDEPSKIISAIRIAKRTLFIAQENIVFALAVKFLVLGLGAAGFASIWAAIFADVGVSVIAILNAIRVLGFYKKC